MRFGTWAKRRFFGGRRRGSAFPKPMAGRTAPTNRYTVALTTSASGRTFPLYVIGRARKPHCFGKKKDPQGPWNPETVGVHYAWQNKAWMTGAFWKDWLRWVVQWDGRERGSRRGTTTSLWTIALPTKCLTRMPTSSTRHTTARTTRSS